jgi:integrase
VDRVLASEAKGRGFDPRQSHHYFESLLILLGFWGCPLSATSPCYKGRCMTAHMFRRPHIWWVRLVVPKILRERMGRREFIQSCRTTDIEEAKAVAAVLLGRWRLELLDLRLNPMSINIEKLLAAQEPKNLDGLMTTGDAAEQLGVTVEKLFSAMPARNLRLWCRLVWVKGWVFAQGSKVIDKAFVTPSGERMRPSTPIEQPSFEDFPDAYEYTEHGVVEVHRAIDVLHEIKECTEPQINVLAVNLRPSGVMFPKEPLKIQLDKFLIDGRTFVQCCNRIKEQLSEKQIKKTEAAADQRHSDRVAAKGAKSQALYSEAVDAFVKQELSRTNGNPRERERVKRSLLLFRDFMGDMKLGDITTDCLRRFRDEHLATVPNRLNHAEKKFKTKGVIATINAIKESGSDWPPLSLVEQDERMTKLNRLFKWLKGEWLNVDIAEPLRGVSVMTKEQQKAQKLKQQQTERKSFTNEELALIFNQSWFTTGSGLEAERTGINRKWATFEYWFPLIAIHGGQRIGEISQLHLSDLKQTKKGVWYFDINENTADKNLKNSDSKRVVPVHSTVLECGLIEWVQALREAGYQRLFPELTWSEGTRYRKEPVRRMSTTLKTLGMERDGTKVFHSFRHTVNNMLIRQDMERGVTDLLRKRLLGHTAGESVNVSTYFEDFTADELASYVMQLNAGIKVPTKFNIDAGLSSIEKAIKRKLGARRGKEDMGPLNK